MACPSSILSPASTYTSVTSSPAGTMTFSGSSDSRAPVPDTCWLRSARMTCADTTEPSPSSAASDPNMGEEPAASVFPLCPLFKNADFAPQPTNATAARIAIAFAGVGILFIFPNAISRVSFLCNIFNLYCFYVRLPHIFLLSAVYYTKNQHLFVIPTGMNPHSIYLMTEFYTSLERSYSSLEKFYRPYGKIL